MPVSDDANSDGEGRFVPVSGDDANGDSEGRFVPVSDDDKKIVVTVSTKAVCARK